MAGDKKNINSSHAQSFFHRKYDRKNDLVNAECRLIMLLNHVRKTNGLHTLTKSASLTIAAHRHAEDVAFSVRATVHTGSDESSVATRAKQSGFDFRYVCENVGRGQRSPDHIVGSWMKSKLHSAGVLAKLADRIGVAVVEDDDGRACWVMVVGKRKRFRSSSEVSAALSADPNRKA